MRRRVFVLSLLLSLELAAQECGCSCPITEISLPCYDGGWHIDGSWVYLRPTATDADLEYGSFITLTVDPANLNARLLEVEPSYRSGYDLSLGYVFCSSNQSLHARYFGWRGSGRDDREIAKQTELIQNFLGASYSTSEANSRHEVDQAYLSYRFDSMIDECVNCDLSLGLTYANLRRDFSVEYADLVLNPTPSELSGFEKSRYWGIGPFMGIEFGFPLLCGFGITGGLEGGVLFGERCARVFSDSLRNGREDSFDSGGSSHSSVTNLNCDLALSYACPISCNWEIELKLGYQVRYYFKPINRINPFNGYVNNPHTFPVEQASNLGLGGPYLLLSFNQTLFPACCQLSCCSLLDPWAQTGAHFALTSYWLEPRPTNKDLVFAVIDEPSSKQRELQADPGLTWAGKYQLGYTFCPGLDLRLSALFFNSSSAIGRSASPGETISSVNASGPAFVVFSGARSDVAYEMDQYDGLLGKSMQLGDCFHLHGGVGLRYLKQVRHLTNVYLGGEPPLTTQVKFPKLKSRYTGIGPLFALEPSFGPFWNLELVGALGLAFLVGESRATLDQDNFGVLGFSSNDLRTPSAPLIAPIFEGSAGVRWDYDCFSCMHIGLEGGYEYLAYYKTVRLLLPTLLTGLEQINSNLILQGPYVLGQIGLSF